MHELVTIQSQGPEGHVAFFFARISIWTVTAWFVTVTPSGSTSCTVLSAFFVRPASEIFSVSMLEIFASISSRPAISIFVGSTLTVPSS